MSSSFDEQGVVNQGQALEAGHEEAGICRTGNVTDLADTVWMPAKQHEGASRIHAFLCRLEQSCDAASESDGNAWIGTCS